ncbi:hypothetical protein NQ318_022787, partial [Aromia moschata]
VLEDMSNIAGYSTQGVQQLLTAEKRATEKVAASRKRKARRLKQAQDEGEEEVDQFRRECEAKYKEFLKRYAGSQDDVQANIEADTKRKIEELNRVASTQREDVSLPLNLTIQ